MANANHEELKRDLIDAGISETDADLLLKLAEDLNDYEPINDLIGETPRDD